MKKDIRSYVIVALLVCNAFTLGALFSRPAQAGFLDFTKLLGIVDLERRLRADGVALIGDATHLRQRAITLKSELDQTYQRLGVTDVDLKNLNAHLDELRSYRDIVNKMSGR